MKVLAIIPAILAFAATPAGAVPGGNLGVLLNGPWTCEIPGDAVVRPVAQQADNFRIVADSSYVIADGSSGTYLRLGNEVRMTSGPFNGRRFLMSSDAMMRLLDGQGRRTGLRCVRAGTSTSGLEPDMGDLKSPVERLNP